MLFRTVGTATSAPIAAAFICYIAGTAYTVSFFVTATTGTGASRWSTIYRFPTGKGTSRAPTHIANYRNFKAALYCEISYQDQQSFTIFDLPRHLRQNNKVEYQQRVVPMNMLFEVKPAYAKSRANPGYI